MGSRFIKIALLVGLSVSSSATSFAVGPVSSPDAGARAGSTSATGYVEDTNCDDNAAQGQFRIQGSVYKLDNKSGCGSKVTKTYRGKITEVRACTVKTFAPDPCSAWV